MGAPHWGHSCSTEKPISDQFFPALVAEGRAGHVLGLAFGTGPGRWPFIRRMTASGAEPGIGGQVFTAIHALTEDELLVTAKGAEP